MEPSTTPRPGHGRIRLRLFLTAVLLSGWAIGIAAKKPSRPEPPQIPVVRHDTLHRSPPLLAAVPEKPPEIIGTDIPVENWIGHGFVCLPMPALFKKFGYELYTTPNLAKETAVINPAIENKKHRLLYERFVGKTLVVTSVTKNDSEYLVSFSEPQSKQGVFGQTHNRALQGIALAEDIELAQKRWLGKEIYARKRFISTFDSVKSTVGSFKTAIETPLLVTGIRWGLTPMPVQPIWVMVTAPSGEKGFIGTWFSWTNVMDNLRKYGSKPWADDLFEENPKKIFSWTEDIWDQVNTHNVITGMTGPQVILAWNDPLKRDTLGSTGGATLRWTYQGQFLYFKNDTLTRIENR